MRDRWPAPERVVDPNGRQVNPQPLVSVIVTTRNRLTLLLRAVQSVDAQDYPNREILVLDDASDGASDYIRSHYPGVRLFRFDENRGLIVARNLLKMEAKGDYIVSLDDDAYFVNKDAISKVVERMQRESELAVVTFHYLPKPLVDGDGALDRRTQEHYTNFFWGYGHCIRRDAFESVGDYRGFFFHQGEEDDLAIRLLDAGYRLLYSSMRLSSMRGALLRETIGASQSTPPGTASYDHG